MTRGQWLRGGGYVAFTLVAWVASMWATLPVEAIAQRLAYEVNRQSAGVWALTYGRTSTWRLSGLGLDEVRLRRARPDQAAQVWGVDRLRVRVQLLPLLLARLSVAWELAAGDGHLRGIFAPGRAGAWRGEVEAHLWPLDQPPVAAEVLGLPVAGQLAGRADMAWEPDLRRAAGRGEVALLRLGVGPGTVAGIGLPTVGIGDLEATFELKDGRFSLGGLKQSGGNLHLGGRAALVLKEPLGATGLELCFTLRLDPAFLAANPKVRSAIQLAEMQLKRDGEGFLHVPVGGTLAAPRVGGGMCR